MERSEEEKFPTNKIKTPTTTMTTTKFTPRVAVAAVTQASKPPPSASVRNPYVNRKIVSKAMNTTNNSYGNNGISSETGAKRKNSDYPSVTNAKKSGTASAFKTPRTHGNTEPQQPPYWERLPSRNVSFTSAEILTITECLKEDQYIAKLYYEEGRSVRVTGILQHRSFRPFEDSTNSSIIVEMDIKDPITTTTKAEADRLRANDSRVATASTPFRKKQQTLPTPSKLSFTPNTFKSTRNGVHKRLQSKKRPWFVNSGLRGRNWNKSSETIPQAPATLRIIVDARSVAGADTSLKTAVVGSFITVIGDFVVASHANIASKTDESGTSRSNQAIRYELEARTLLVINNHIERGNGTNATTDSSFYDRALTLRRKTMYERYHYRSSTRHSRTPFEEVSDDKKESNRPVLLQGCGPPPYDAFDIELDQKSVENPKRKEKQANPV